MNELKWGVGQTVAVNINALHERYGEKLTHARIKPPQKSASSLFEIYSKGPTAYVASEADIGTISAVSDNYIVIDYIRSSSIGITNISIAVGLWLTREEAETGLMPIERTIN